MNNLLSEIADIIAGVALKGIMNDSNKSAQEILAKVGDVIPKKREKGSPYIEIIQKE